MTVWPQGQIIDPSKSSSYNGKLPHARVCDTDQLYTKSSPNSSRLISLLCTGNVTTQTNAKVIPYNNSKKTIAQISASFIPSINVLAEIRNSLIYGCLSRAKWYSVTVVLWICTVNGRMTRKLVIYLYYILDNEGDDFKFK